MSDKIPTQVATMSKDSSPDSSEGKSPNLPKKTSSKKPSILKLFSFLYPKSAAKIPQVPKSSKVALGVKKPIAPPSFKGGSKKKLVILLIGLMFLLIVVLAIALFVKRKPENKVGERGKLTWWGFRNKEVVEPLIRRFESENPDISIEYQKQGEKDYRERLSNLIQKESAPDIFTLHNSWVPMFSTDLGDIPQSVMDSDVFGDTFYPVISKDLLKDGKARGIPLGFDTLVLFVNQDLLSTAFVSAPKTWVQFEDTAEF